MPTATTLDLNHQDKRYGLRIRYMALLFHALSMWIVRVNQLILHGLAGADKLCGLRLKQYATFTQV